MAKSLIIVESPAKARTIKKYLGRDYNVEASSGHLVDLPSSKLGVDVEKDFEPKYVVIKDKRNYLSKLKKAAKDVDKIYLASDPDREGEAIAWHIVDQLGIRDRAYRVLFYEITENSIKKAMENPLTLSKERFEAQQARRILDRLVGYKVSPILWKKVRKGLSAGRVQSVALRMIVEREREIDAFVPVEHWSVEALLRKDGDDDATFTAKLSKYKGEKAEVGSEEQAVPIVEALRNENYKVLSVEKKQRQRKAFAPFITSTLQQEASRKLRFPVKKTMTIAQKLYEGIELGAEGPVGLITYMRTDSVRVSDHALGEVRAYITEKYGSSYLPDKPNVFKVKKSAQDAHEAIRPTFVSYEPESVRKHLSSDEYRLYELIWKRFVSSQMSPAVYDQTTVEIEAGEGIFRATGSVIRFKGFTAVYTESREEEESNGNEAKEKEEDVTLPELRKDEVLRLLNLEGIQHFTQPLPRFTESSLVKELEEKGIGRPSTYALILSTIQNREYVIKERARLIPTLLGKSVTDYLTMGFPEVMDIKFTAAMEENLDRVEEGSVNWVELLKTFYKGFSRRLDEAEQSDKSIRREGVPTDISCDACGAPMIIKWGKKGEFLSCSKYPDCKNAKRFKYGTDGKVEVVVKKEQDIREDVRCELCGEPMALRSSKYGKFFGCTGYPECRGIRKLTDVEAQQSEHGSGDSAPEAENAPEPDKEQAEV
ncbi:MAG: type I DNA topoisomerase [Candidatus Dadabacteria bacterium]|nr:type I DNA topoisomerase [Candidatus Dadabacteria bacterium]